MDRSTARLTVAAPPLPGRGRFAFAGLLVFIGFVYTNPSNLIPALGDYGYAKGVAALALLSLGAAWLLTDRRLTLGGRIGWCVALFFFVVGASAAWSPWPSLTVDHFADGLKYLAIFVLAANVIDEPRRLHVLLHVLAWATLAPAIGTIVSWSQGEHLVEGDRAAWIGTFANPNDLAYFLAVGITLMLGMRHHVRSHGLRLAYLGALAVMGLAILLTQSRGGMIAAGTVIALNAVLGVRHRRIALGAIAVLAVGALLAPERVWQRASSTLEYEDDASARGRIDAWRTGMNMIAARPLHGVGAGAFQLSWPEFAPGDAGEARTAHNTYVQIAAETGLPSLIVYLAAIGLAMVGLERVGRRRPELLDAIRSTQLALVAFLVASATGGLAYNWPSFLLLGAAAGMMRTEQLERQRTGA